LPREILNKSPIPASETTIEEPPLLMNGSATPVKGRRPVTTATLTNAWKTSQQVTPHAKSAAKASGASRAILKPR
jgi:hypothetical protein